MAEKKEKKKVINETETVETETTENTETLETVQAELTAARAEIERLTAEKAEEHDRFLRTAAEYDNYRRRTAEEMSRKFNDGKAEALEKLLPVIDSVRMAMSGEHDEEDPIYKGICLIAKQLHDTMTAMGVTEIPTDIPFDPNLHNAVMHIDDDTKGEGEIVDVFAVGYKMGDRVLRHTMVRVAN